MKESNALKIVTHNGEIFLPFETEKEKAEIIKRFPDAHRVEQGTLYGTRFINGAKTENTKPTRKKKSDVSE